MITLICLISLPIFGIAYLCLNQKHKGMVNELLKKAFGWLIIRRKKKNLEDGDARKDKLEQTQQKKEQEIKEQVKKDIEEVKVE
ncbi:hypothetical protein RF55_21344 [Lasius niger]|uniref:Uncharacterized protein n=1 Tax=Lasius niger TaxID=67767 RepID=A0A0J7JY44_LASNI|nr:hypothetical protein RF55_21344 [Lasius niger]